MSSRFKFRGWDTINKKMLEVENIDFRNEYISLNEGDNALSDTFEMITLMQCTGMKDSKGQDIYEGDIVTYKVKGSKKINKTIMKYNKEHGAFLFGIYEGVTMPSGKKTRKNKYTRKSINDVYVIGNIFEGEILNI